LPCDELLPLCEVPLLPPVEPDEPCVEAVPPAWPEFDPLEDAPLDPPLLPDCWPVDADGAVGQLSGRGSEAPAPPCGLLLDEPCWPPAVCGPEPPDEELEEEDWLPDDCDDDPPEEEEGDEDEDDEPPDEDGDCEGELDEEPPGDPLEPDELDGDELGIGIGIVGLGIELLELVFVAQPPAASVAASTVSPAKPEDRFISPLDEPRAASPMDCEPKTTAYSWIRRAALGSNISVNLLLQERLLSRRTSLWPTHWS